MKKTETEFYEKYFKLISQVDTEVKLLEEYYKSFNYECSANCTYNSRCCRVPLKIYPIELHAIKYFMSKNNFVLKNIKNDSISTCNFLINNTCSIYKYRPVICRIFGIINKRYGIIIGPDCGTDLLKRLKDNNITPIKFIDSDIIFAQIEKLNREFLHFNKKYQFVKFDL